MTTDRRPGRRDRLGASTARHPVWTALGLAVLFYLFVAVPQAVLLDAWLVMLVVMAPVSLAYGAFMVMWLQSNPAVRSRLDPDRLRRFRAGVRAARRGRPVDLDPELAALLTEQAGHEARTLRRLRPVVPFVGVVIAMAGVAAALLDAWVWAVLVWIVAVIATALLWWVFRREMRLAESLAERS